MAERKKQEEERRIREIEEKKQRDIEEKRQRLEEAEKKRQAMMAALKDQSKTKGPNFTITKREAGVGYLWCSLTLTCWPHFNLEKKSRIGRTSNETQL